VLFLAQLGFNKTQIGTLLSVLSFSNLVSLIVAPAVGRFGYKRTFLTFWGVRNGVTVLLLFTPWVLTRFGTHITLIYVVVISAGFAISRSVGMTALYPWMQEYIPNAVRGKYTATENIFTNLSAFAAVTAAGYILGPTPDLDRFVILFGAAVLFGIVSIWAFSFVPGGASTRGTHAERTSPRDLAAAARDRNLMRYLAGVGLITLATVPLNSFLPLFMQEQVGLPSGKVVLLQTGTLVGGLLSSYLWGWASDRYGSKPVMLWSVALFAALPFGWWLLPRQAPLSFYLALAISTVQGLANIAWQIGSGRLLFVSVVPPERNNAYMALYSAWIGIGAGISKLAGGWILERSAGLSGRFLIFSLDAYAILFVIGITLPLASLGLLGKVRADGNVSMAEFATLFLRGNPFRALEFMIRYHRARDERAAVSITERLGQTKSPLTVDELLEALADPRFNVRFEAVISIARRDPDPRTTEALVRILGGNEPALSVIAAWALGRTGDRQAIGPLRQALDAPYRSVQAHSARALATLEDRETLPELLRRMEYEMDGGLKLAYASALGKLGAEEAVGALLTLLNDSTQEDERMQLALALARIVGDEAHFIRLSRQAQQESGTVASQEIAAIRKRLSRSLADDQLQSVLLECQEALAREDLTRGALLVGQVIDRLPIEEFNAAGVAVLRACAGQLQAHGAARVEYLLLALQTLDALIR